MPMKSLQLLCTAFYAQSGPIFAFRVTLKTFYKCKKSYEYDERDSIQYTYLSVFLFLTNPAIV